MDDLSPSYPDRDGEVDLPGYSSLESVVLVVVTHRRMESVGVELRHAGIAGRNFQTPMHHK